MSSSEEGQQHPLNIYFWIWGLLFVVSGFSYMVDYLNFQGYTRWTLIIIFMFVKAGFIVGIFMHMTWERLALKMAILLPPIAILIFIGMMMSKGFDSVYNAALTMFDGATNFPLLAIPLFILAGALMNTTSISRRLINLTSAMIGFVRGGLAMVNVGVSMFFAEISGSAVADVAALGSVLIPAMKEN